MRNLTQGRHQQQVEKKFCMLCCHHPLATFTKIPETFWMNMSSK
jgi:hypothetical protein